MTTRCLIWIVIAILCEAMTACDLAPPYTRPSTPTPSAFKENAGWHASTGSKVISTGSWWSVFNDNVLNNLEEKTHTGNQNLQGAIARYDQALAALAGARGALFPQVSGAAEANRQRVSQTTADALGTKAQDTAINGLETATGGHSLPSAGNEYNDFKPELDVSYDFDVFGRLRNTVAAAGHEAQASADDMAALLLALQAQVAESYFTLRADDEQIDILEQSVKAYQTQLKLTQDLFQGEIAAESDVDQARLQLDNAAAALQDMQLKRSQIEHALAVLVGEPPSSFTVPAAAFNPVMTLIDPGLPSQLLERRPDIAAAERRVAENNEKIGVARAAWFPDFILTGSAGFESETLSHLISAPSLFWTVGPQVTQTIFDGGKIAAQVASARAAYRETVANYRQAALTATQEVEDNLASLRQYGLETGNRQAAVADASRSLQQALDRYHGGIDTYLNVTIQENAALQAKQSLIETRMHQVLSYILLIKALGGDTPNHR